MNMNVSVIETAGVGHALVGIGLSHGIFNYEDIATGNREKIEAVVDRVVRRADALAPLDGGHNKYLESIISWVLIKAPRYWWQEMDTYRHLSKQSGSTMHTITKRLLTQDDFVEPIYTSTLVELNNYISVYQMATDTAVKERLFRGIKANLPEGFLQTRMVRLDMMSLRNIYRQRCNHRLEEWKFFLSSIKEQLPGRLWSNVTSGINKGGEDGSDTGK